MRVWIIVLGFFLVSFLIQGETKGRDPFQPPQGGVEVPPAPSFEKIEESPPEQLILTGTLVHPRGSFAIINGRILKEGNKIAGYTLIRIERKRVLLEKEGKRFVLSLGSLQNIAR